MGVCASSILSRKKQIILSKVNKNYTYITVIVNNRSGCAFFLVMATYLPHVTGGGTDRGFLVTKKTICSKMLIVSRSTSKQHLIEIPNNQNMCIPMLLSMYNGSY